MIEMDGSIFFFFWLYFAKNMHVYSLFNLMPTDWFDHYKFYINPHSKQERKPLEKLPVFLEIAILLLKE